MNHRTKRASYPRTSDINHYHGPRSSKASTLGRERATFQRLSLRPSASTTFPRARRQHPAKPGRDGDPTKGRLRLCRGTMLSPRCTSALLHFSDSPSSLSLFLRPPSLNSCPPRLGDRAALTIAPASTLPRSHRHPRASSATPNPRASLPLTRARRI